MYEGMSFGIEVETVKITRKDAALAIQSVVGGEVRYVGSPSCYDPWDVIDSTGRTWKVVADASLSSVPFHLRAEIVSPILSYDDMAALQEIVRALRRAGGKIDHRCGIHVHVGSAPFDAAAMGRLAKLVYKQEPLILHALGVSSERLQRYARPINDQFINSLVTQAPRTTQHLNRLWYGYQNDSPQHYDSTRYHGVNFHNVWFRGTIEFRWFNGTLHAGKVKSYIQLVLAIAQKALKSRCASAKHKRPFDPRTAKYDFRVFLLNLGMIGDEFKTARHHLLNNMPGDAAFRNGRPVRTAV